MRPLLFAFVVAGIFNISRAQCGFSDKSFNKTDDYISSGLIQLYNKFNQTVFKEFSKGIDHLDNTLVIHSLSDSGWVFSSLAFQDSILLILKYELGQMKIDTVLLDGKSRNIVKTTLANEDFHFDGTPAYKMGLNHFKKFLFMSSKSCFIYQVDYPTDGKFQDFWNVVNFYIYKE